MGSAEKNPIVLKKVLVICNSVGCHLVKIFRRSRMFYVKSMTTKPVTKNIYHHF